MMENGWIIMNLCPKVAELVTSEFFEQGDRERSELKLTPAVSKKSLIFHSFFSSTHISLSYYVSSIHSNHVLDVTIFFSSHK